MASNTYNVGGHNFVLNFCEDDILLNNLNAFEPFIVKEDTLHDLLFTLTIASNFEFQTIEKQIGTFDSDVAIFDVDATIDGGYIFTIKANSDLICGQLQVSPDFSSATVVACNSPKYRYFTLTNSTMLVYAMASAKFCTLMMHASVVKQGGKGYLFLAKSGTGKSTHSSLWIKNIAGAELLNDDNPIVRIDKNGTVKVYGSPWSGKTPCYKNNSVTVGAFVKISQSPENRIYRSRTLQGFAAVLPSCSTLQWDKRVHQAVCDTVAGIVQSTKIFALDCRPDNEAALLCYNTIVQ